MKYSLSWLIEAVKQKQTFKYIYFWGHQPTQDGTITKTCMSQWWVANFEVDGVTYSTAEHWMMAEKARLFGDDEILASILQAKSPGEAKKLGRKVKGFEQNIWEKERFEIVRKGNLYKFSQNKKLKDYLLATNTRILVEASPYDAIWGIGMPQDHPNIGSAEKWKGLNLLGFALMEVRDELKSLE